MKSILETMIVRWALIFSLAIELSSARRPYQPRSVAKVAYNDQELDQFKLNSRVTELLLNHERDLESLLEEEEDNRHHQQYNQQHNIKWQFNHNHEQHKHHRQCPHGWYGCSDDQCIIGTWVCDGHKDCDDGSDEFGCGYHKTSTNERTINTSTKSIINNHEDAVTSVPPIKKPTRAGSKKVDQMTSKGAHKWNGSIQPLMLFSSGKEIRVFWMGTRSYYPVHTVGPSDQHGEQLAEAQISPYTDGEKGNREPQGSRILQPLIVGLDMVSSSKEVFWVELGPEMGAYRKIIGLPSDEKYDSVSKNTIVDGGLIAPEDIAVDLIGKNVYITDAGLPAIVVCSINGNYCLKLIKDNIEKPRAIIVSPRRGQLFYTDWGFTFRGIYQASMNGRNRRTLIDTDINWPNGLALDEPISRLYWADASLRRIEFMDLKTNTRHLLMQENLFYPYSLAIFEDKIYWSDWKHDNIISCNKYTGKNLTHELSTEYNIYGVHIYHPDIHSEKFEDPCWSKQCSHLCLLEESQPSKRHDGNNISDPMATCQCPEGMKLNLDNEIECIPWVSSFVLLNARNYIAQAYPNQIGQSILRKIIYKEDHKIHDISHDWARERMFFFDGSTYSIYMIDFKHTIVEDAPRASSTVFTPSLILKASPTVRGLTSDPWGNNLYWVDSNRGTMSMTPVDQPFELIMRQDLGRPVDLVLDDKNRQFYISILGTDAHILRTDIHGNNEITIIGAEIGLPVSLHLDSRFSRLYWADGRLMSIESLDLDPESQTSGIKANSRTRHLDRLTFISSMTIHEGSFLWTRRDGNYLYREIANLGSVEKRSQLMSLRLPPGDNQEANGDTMKLVLVDPDYNILDSPCASSGCSHGCIMDRNQTTICYCPENYLLDRHNSSHCIEGKLPCPDTMFDCSDDSHHPNDCRGDHSRCNNSQCIIHGDVWICDYGESSVTNSEALQLTNPGHSLVIVVLFITAIGLVATITFMLIYWRANLPKHLSNRFRGPVTVSFKPGFTIHGKDDEEILIDN